MALMLTTLVLLGLAFWTVECLPLVDDSDNSPVMFYGNVSYTLEDILEELQNTTNLDLEDDANTVGERLPRSGCIGCLASPAYGGRGGSAFSDYTISSHTCDNIAAIRQIKLYTYRSGYIIGIQVLYEYTDNQTHWGPQHGGTCTHGDYPLKEEFNVYFGRGEQIQTIIGRADALDLKQLTFITNTPSGTRNIHGPYGIFSTGNFFVINANVVSFYGRRGCRVDSIGFFYRQCPMC